MTAIQTKKAIANQGRACLNPFIQKSTVADKTAKTPADRVFGSRAFRNSFSRIPNMAGNAEKRIPMKSSVFSEETHQVEIAAAKIALSANT